MILGKPVIKIENIVKCVIVKRINRFIVEVIIKGKRTEAYVNNTGRLIDYIRNGKEGFCAIIEKPKKARYRLFAVKDCGFSAVVDTSLQMKAFEKAIELEFIPWLKGWMITKKNIRLGESLIDYLLKCGDVELYIEVKSAVLRENNYAMYPDCPSLRGRRHINELIDLVEKGGKGLIAFIAAIPEASAFKPYRSGDPQIYKLLNRADKKGVIIKSLSMYYNSEDSFIYIDNPDIPVVL